MRGAILGAGNVAVRGHLPGWLARADVEIVAAADPRPAGRADFSRLLPGARWYGSAQQLLANESVHFADIASPPAMHAGLIRACLERGVHVLCEKPLVLSREELDPLAALARGKGLALATVHNWRNAPILAAAQDAIGRGVLGEVRSCRWETLRRKPAAAASEGEVNWRVDPAVAGGGVLMDHGWHALYVVCGWLPERPARVAGRLSTRKHREWALEDTAEIALETAGGARAEIFLTWAADERRNRVEVTGTRGTLRIDGSVLECLGERLEFSQSLSEGSQHPEWFAPVAENFLEEARSGGGSRATLEEAFLCLDAIEGAREPSARGGEAVAIVREEVST
ncbi:MAG TPA: Gfo/Idh/MocA family oxidoreductase [Thermoanaerobaculia bacterium]|nr:Gfo/Idh/MocA family oxidoreductase [Thermoanaerobaculia bacterium]